MSRNGSRYLGAARENGAPGRPTDGPLRGPIIVLASGYSGVDRLESILAGYPGLACTSGTGILPLCAQAVATWQRHERTTAGMSAMAASSVKALATTMITCVLAAGRGSRWCETATAAAPAGTFARLFPQAQFVCFYRACGPVIAEATRAARWGLGDAGIADFAAAYPGNSVAAVAAYWRASTTALLDFETAHPGRSLRVRHEDLTASPAAATSAVAGFLGLDERQPGLRAAAQDLDPATGAPGADTGDGAEPIPAGLIPAPMLDRINGLHARLGYPALAPEEEPELTRLAARLPTRG
jgi:Sulfotransferase family